MGEAKCQHESGFDTWIVGCFRFEIDKNMYDQGYIGVKLNLSRDLSDYPCIGTALRVKNSTVEGINFVVKQ